MFNNITVIGSGLMGSAIAAHLVNAGCKVNLLDIVNKKHENKNHLADLALNKLTKIKPSPLTLNSNLKLIKTGSLPISAGWEPVGIDPYKNVLFRKRIK